MQVQALIGAKRAMAFDLTAACSGFVVGLITAAQFIRTGQYRNIIIIGADALSRYVDWRDRGKSTPAVHLLCPVWIMCESSGHDYEKVPAHTARSGNQWMKNRVERILDLCRQFRQCKELVLYAATRKSVCNLREKCLCRDVYTVW